MNIHTVFAQRPTIRTVVQLKAPLEITAPTSQLVKLRHVGVGLAPPGLAGSGSNLTGGAGIVVVGSEIRLSIGTLPNMN